MAGFGPARVLRGAAIALLASAAVALASGGASGRAPLPAFHSGHGLNVLSQHWLDSRLVDVEVRTAALPQPLHIRILVPAGYAQHPHRRYPVLYLFDGTSGRASDWTTQGAAEQTTAGLPLIVVMPDITMNGDGGGWCTNWPDGKEKWETFHIGQLVPWVDHSLRTDARRGGRAIAGLSQGGFCSMSYAARHPDLFSVALAYSGAPDIYYDPDARAGASAIINATEVGLDRTAPDSMFGNPVSDGINWAAHDPATLAPNLRQTRLYMYFGNGLPGPYDTPSTYSSGWIEAAVNRDNIDFHARLDSLHIPSLYRPYGNGTHSWPYWARDLRWSIPLVMRDFAHPPSPPASVTYTSADGSYSVYGWTVRMHRSVREFSTLSGAAARGFTLAGSGWGTVITPPLYKSGGRYSVHMRFSRGGSRTIHAVARHRRLRLQVPLGPSNRYQADTPQAALAGTAVYRTRVAISVAAA